MGTSLLNDNGGIGRNLGDHMLWSPHLLQGSKCIWCKSENAYDVRVKSDWFADIGLLASVMRVFVIHINKIPLIKGPIVFDSRIGSKMLSFLG